MAFLLNPYIVTAGIVTFPTGTTSGSTSSSDLSNKTVTFNSDGSLSYTAGLSAALSPTGWFDPIVTDIGNNYWIKANSITLSGTTSPRTTVGTIGSWIALSSAPAFGLKATSTGGTGTTTATVNYSIASDSGGTNILGTASFAVQMGYF